MCRSCNQEKPGEGSPCRACRAVAERERRRLHGDAIRAADRARRRAHAEGFILRDMIRRCEDPRRKDFRHYGAKGIAVCQEWHGPGGLERFLLDVGHRPSSHHSIDRIDNARGYEPGNCRWATQKEQTRNFSRNRLIAAHGRTQTLAAWSEELGAEPRLIHQRLDLLGWDPERAVSLDAGATRRTA